jgi:hypothetical protein
MTMYAVSILPNGCTSWREIASESDLLPGESLSTVVPSPTMPDVASTLMQDVQAWLDATASQNGYDSIASCISYKNSAITQWAADATAAIAWRDAVWQACFQWQQSASANPPATFPTSAQVIDQLPQPTTFGWVSHQPGATA